MNHSRSVHVHLQKGTPRPGSKDAASLAGGDAHIELEQDLMNKTQEAPNIAFMPQQASNTTLIEEGSRPYWLAHVMLN